MKTVKHILLLLTLGLFISCDFSTVEHDIKKVSEISGVLDTIPDSTGLEMVSFSGFNPDSSHVWTQAIAFQLPERRLIRIITPQNLGIKVEEKMIYRSMNLDLMLAETISFEGSDGEIKGENLERLKEVFANIGKTANDKKIDFDTVKVFFNPKFSETENQELPIVVGKLETLDGHSLGAKFVK